MSEAIAFDLFTAYSKYLPNQLNFTESIGGSGTISMYLSADIFFEKQGKLFSVEKKLIVHVVCKQS